MVSLHVCLSTTPRASGIQAARAGSRAERRLLTAYAPAAILNYMVQYSFDVDPVLTALSDPTRRGIVERLGQSDISISALAEEFGMTLTGIRKHVRILEDAGLVTTEKVGRVRTCRLGPSRLDALRAWIETYRRTLDDRLEAFLDRTGEDP